MAATNHLSPGQWRQEQPTHEQLPMFMDAQTLRESYPSVDSFGMSTDEEDGLQDANDDVMADKLDEATWSAPGKESLFDNISRRGIERPVQVLRGVREPGDHPRWAKGVLGNGGHRVAVAHEIDRNYLVPVHHYDYFYGDARPAGFGLQPTHDAAADFGGWDSPRIKGRHLT